MRQRLAAMILALASCGPSVETNEGSGSGSAGSSSTEETGDDVGSSASIGSSDDTTTSPFPRLDVGEPDRPQACGIEPPHDCTPTWPLEEELAGRDAAFVGEIEGRTVVMFGPPLYVWGLYFDLPCPVDLGAPELVQTRFEMQGQLDMYDENEFEQFVAASYAAIVDVEHLNGCTHLLVHGIEVDPEPLDPEGPVFTSHDLLRTGYVYAL